jgi:hypothetical protein
MIITYFIKKKNIKRVSLLALSLATLDAFAAQEVKSLTCSEEELSSVLRSSDQEGRVFRGIVFAQEDDAELRGAYKESRAHRQATTLQGQVNKLAEEHRVSTKQEAERVQKDLQKLTGKRVWLSSLFWGTTAGGAGFTAGLIGLRLSQHDSVIAGLGAGAAATVVSYKLLNDNRELRIRSYQKDLGALVRAQIRSEQIATNGDGINAVDIAIHEQARLACIDRREIARSILPVPARSGGVGIRAPERNERESLGTFQRARSWLPSAELATQVALTGGVIGALVWHASQK